MSIKDLEKPLSCVTHWNSSLLSNRKKGRKGNENGFGISFSDWEKKIDLCWRKNKECSVSCDHFLFGFGCVLFYGMKQTKWKDIRKKNQ